MMITADGIMELIQEDGAMDEWCNDCPEQRTPAGATEGGLQIEPDETVCPCDFDLSETRCVMHAKYKEAERIAEVLAAYINRIGGEGSDD